MQEPKASVPAAKGIAGFCRSRAVSGAPVFAGFLLQCPYFTDISAVRIERYTLISCAYNRAFTTVLPSAAMFSRRLLYTVYVGKI